MGKKKEDRKVPLLRGQSARSCCMVARHDDNPIDLTENDEDGDDSSAEEDEQGE